MRIVITVGLAAVLSVPAASSGDGVEKTVEEILTRHENGADAPKEFEIQEQDANTYIRARSVQELPEGVESPWVKFEDSLAIVGATLDLDKLGPQLPSSPILQLLSGRVPVEVTTRVVAAAGIGKLVLERVTLSGVELPPDVVESLIGTPDTTGFLPPGFRLGEAFTLPFDLESIQCLQGTVKVLQRASVK